MIFTVSSIALVISIMVVLLIWLRKRTKLIPVFLLMLGTLILSRTPVLTPVYEFIEGILKIGA
jgi:hypothetical protein